MKGTRLLIVDDHPSIREGIRRLLEPEKRIMVVGEAASAEEAIRTLEMHAADVVLMDIKLPGMDGIEATRQLSEKCPELKIIILSAFGDEYLT